MNHERGLRVLSLISALMAVLVLMWAAFLVGRETAPTPTSVPTLTSPAQTPAMQLPEIESAHDLGVLSQPPSVMARGGGASTLVGGQVLWTFGGSLLTTLAEDGALSRSSMAAWGDPSTPLNVSEPLDAAGAPFEFLQFTEDEQAYNESGAQDHYSLTPVGVVDAGDGNALVFYNKSKLGPTLFDLQEIGTGLARVQPAKTTAIRDPELLFTAPDPVFDSAFIFQSDVYLYDCYKDGGLSTCRVARAPLDRAAERAAYQFWNGSAWVSDTSQAEPVIDGTVASGLSVSWNPYLGKFLAVYSGVFSNRVFLRVAPLPEGPWSVPVEMFVGMPPANPQAYISQAREHPELASNGGRTVVISYSRPLGDFKGELRLIEVTFR